MNETTMLEVHLDDEERDLVLGMLKQALSDARVEVHRTHTPDYRQEVIHREDVLRRIIEKLRPAIA